MNESRTHLKESPFKFIFFGRVTLTFTASYFPPRVSIIMGLDENDILIDKKITYIATKNSKSYTK